MGKVKNTAIRTKKVSLGGIVEERLPLPFVHYPSHYGTFFAFSEKVDSTPNICSCSIPALENYFRLSLNVPKNQNSNKLRMAPLSSWFFPDAISRCSLLPGFDGINSILFREGICHRCQMTVPSWRYCHQMYGTEFVQTFGWYINQAYLRIGVDRSDLTILTEFCPEDLRLLISDYKKTLSVLHEPLNERENNSDSYKRKTKDHREITKYVENLVRSEFGIRPVGEAWVSESILAQIVRKLFPQEPVVTHYRPSWLNRLEIDIYIDNLRLGFEYQGQQHFHAVEAWGGIEALNELRERDKLKKSLCRRFGVRLICINYFDPLTEQFVDEKIRSLDE